MIESKDCCYDLVHAVVAKNKTTGWFTDRLIIAYGNASDDMFADCPMSHAKRVTSNNRLKSRISCHCRETANKNWPAENTWKTVINEKHISL